MNSQKGAEPWTKEINHDIRNKIRPGGNRLIEFIVEIAELFKTWFEY